MVHNGNYIAHLISAFVFVSLPSKKYKLSSFAHIIHRFIIVVSCTVLSSRRLICAFVYSVWLYGLLRDNRITSHEYGRINQCIAISRTAALFLSHLIEQKPMRAYLRAILLLLFGFKTYETECVLSHTDAYGRRIDCEGHRNY